MTVDVKQISANIVRITRILEELDVPFTEGYLMNRERVGIPLRHALSRYLTNMTQDTLALDFTGIEEISISVAEEIGPKLFEDFIEHRTRGYNVYLVYCNLSEEIARGLSRHFLDWQSRLDPKVQFSIVTFQSCENGLFSRHYFIGEEIPSALKDALDLIYRLGEANSQILEDHGIKAASRKLNELTKQYPWLIRRVQKSLDTEPRAWAFFYWPVVPVMVVAREW